MYHLHSAQKYECMFIILWEKLTNMNFHTSASKINTFPCTSFTYTPRFKSLKMTETCFNQYEVPVTQYQPIVGINLLTTEISVIMVELGCVMKGMFCVVIDEYRYKQRV